MTTAICIRYEDKYYLWLEQQPKYYSVSSSYWIDFEDGSSVEYNANDVKGEKEPLIFISKPEKIDFIQEHEVISHYRRIDVGPELAEVLPETLSSLPENEEGIMDNIAKYYEPVKKKYETREEVKLLFLGEYEPYPKDIDIAYKVVDLHLFRFNDIVNRLYWLFPCAAHVESIADRIFGMLKSKKINCTKYTNEVTYSDNFGKTHRITVKQIEGKNLRDLDTKVKEYLKEIEAQVDENLSHVTCPFCSGKGIVPKNSDLNRLQEKIKKVRSICVSTSYNTRSSTVKSLCDSILRVTE